MPNEKYRNQSHNINTRKFTLETPTLGKTNKQGFYISASTNQKIITSMPNLAISSTKKI
jgi:hypothetical protein